jgi:digeranylgeranylglycerophospholipid reductase|tara:strand:+ start:4950 stop:6044 length:1095 start_codon:yes stop_codon:yes gene_type:complete
MSYDWDAIIIGGGPAGSTVARYAARTGAKVLVIDRRKTIGTPLQCGELVPTNEELKLLCPNVPDIDDLFQTPDEAISRITHTMGIVSPSGNRLEYPFEGQILNRPIHDQKLVNLAKKEGAEYLTKSRVNDVIDNEVILKSGESLSANIIVGCGGPHDILRKKFWNESSLNIAVNFVLMDGDFDNRVDLFFGSIAPGGYAWMIPKEGGANIGIGIQTRFSKNISLTQMAETFFNRFEGKITYKGGGVLPMSGTISTFVKGNYMLVGDSAGMVLPSNGAGITTAMTGGRIAGQAIGNYINYGTPISEYQKNWNQQMGSEMKYSKRGIWWGGLMFKSPDWLINTGFNRMTKSMIWRAITCKPMFGLF